MMNFFSFIRRIIFAAIFVVACENVSAQSVNTDSLSKLLRSLPRDTQRVNVLNKLAFAFRTDPQTGLGYAKESIAISTEKNYAMGKASAWNTIGIINYNWGNYDEATEYYLLSLHVYDSLSEWRKKASVENNLALVYSKKGDYKTAIDYNLRSIKLKDQLGDKSGIAKSYLNLGNSFYEQDNLPLALEYGNKALTLYHSLKDSEGIAKSLNNIGSVYYSRTQDDSALLFYRQAQVIRERMGDAQEIASGLNNLGMLLLDLGDMDSAYADLSRALFLRTKLGDNEEMAESDLNLAEYFIRTKNYDDALGVGISGVLISEKIGSRKFRKRGYELLAKIYSLKNDSQDAFAYQKKYSDLSDSLANENNNRQLLEMQAKYESEKKDKELLRQQSTIKQQDLDAANRSAQQKFLFAGIALLLFAVIAVFIGYRQKKKANEEIIAQKKMIEEKNKDITDSITYAKRIQRGFLPGDHEMRSALNEHFVFYQPKDIVSGDFYWLASVHTTPKNGPSKNVVVLSVVDCTGHGVPGALMSIVGCTLVNQTIKNPDVNSCGDALNFLNRELPKNLKKQTNNEIIRDGMDMVMCAIDFENLTLDFAGANNPLYLIRNNALTIYKGDSQAISGSDDLEKKDFIDQTISLEKGDCIYLFTDGYADQFGGSRGKKFKYKQLQEKLVEIHHLRMEEQKSKLENIFNNWKGKLEQVDDVLIIGIRI
ncbi:MAG: tetratricopeptide repeat protein [Bacteroidetes bacterium]|nr:tetratricopeptide repeat protein [Bacteroidota bacterium]